MTSPRHDPHVEHERERVKHFGSIAHRAKQKIERLRKRARWAIAKRTVHRRKLRDARREARRRALQHPKFETYMLNGCPSNITDAAKHAVARGVVIFDCTVTATTNGTHTPTSFHYPVNNASHGYSDNLGHAVDFGGPSGTYDRFFASEKLRGCGLFDELFGPGSGYCDDGALHAGASPDIPNHCHNAPKAKR